MGQGKSRGAVSPVHCAAPVVDNLGDGLVHWIFLDNPALRQREIRVDYDFTASELGRGHFGTVHLGTRKVDNAKVRPITILNVDFHSRRAAPLLLHARASLCPLECFVVLFVPYR